MKIKVKYCKGKRIVTEIKRPDPAAVLVIDEDKDIEVSTPELFLIVDLKYAEASAIVADGKQVKSVYPDTVVFVQPKTEEKPVAKTDEKPVAKVEKKG